MKVKDNIMLHSGGACNKHDGLVMKVMELVKGKKRYIDILS